MFVNYITICVCEYFLLLLYNHMYINDVKERFFFSKNESTIFQTIKTGESAGSSG